MSDEEKGAAAASGAQSGGSQSGQRPGGSDSAPPADDSGKQQEAAGKQSRSVPYERFQELNRKTKAQEREMAQLRQHLAQLTAAGQKGQEAVFDGDTDAGIGKLIDRYADPVKREFQQLKLRVLLSDIRTANPDFGELEEEFFDRFNELMAEGFGDKKTADTILKAIRADRGVYSKQGKDEARNQEKIEAGMAGPGGGGGTRDRVDPAKAFARGSTREERAKFRNKVKAGLVR